MPGVEPKRDTYPSEMKGHALRLDMLGLRAAYKMGLLWLGINERLLLTR